MVCTNEGESEAKGCRTRILSAKRISEKGCEDIGIVQSVALPWDRGDTEGSHLIDIPAAESRQIWLGSVRSNGSFWLFRDVRALPIEYQQLIGGPGLYRILLQIDGSNVPPQQLVLELKVSEGPMVQNGIQRGLLDIEILDHGVPRVGTVA